MPPKTKKKRKSKAEIEAERIVAEEEEKKRQEVEEQRLAEEKAQADERARLDLEAKKNFRLKEIENLICGQKEISAYLTERHNLLQEKLRGERDSCNWKSLLGCNDIQWPTKLDEQTIGEYISSSKEDCDDSLDLVLACVENNKHIIQNLESRILLGELNGVDNRNDTFFISDLKRMTAELIDRATSDLLCESDPPENGELESCCISRTSKIALWANLVGNTEKGKTFSADPQLLVDIPASIANFPVAIRLCHIPYGFASSDVMRRVGLASLGGLIQLSEIKMSPLFRKVDQWTIRQIPDDKQNLFKNEKGLGEMLTKTILVKCKVLDSIIVPQNILIAMWSEEEETWDVNAASGQHFDLKNRTLSFNAHRLGDFSLVQSRSLDFPYKDWIIEPTLNEEHVDEEPLVRFTITTPRFTVSIICREGLCNLLSPDAKELSHLRDSWLPAENLIQELLESGINLLPGDHDGTPDIEIKRKEIEIKCSNDVSMTCTSFIMKSDLVNQKCGEDKACFQVKESEIFCGGSVFSKFKLCIFEKDSASISAIASPGTPPLPSNCGDVKCHILNENESSKFQPASARANENCCLYSIQCLQTESTSESIQRLHTSNPLLTHNVKKL
eukprot:CAMPEP_0194451086 /NCGR_PEP_ID=MMETSP0176-20130528/131106_1 /TAXON_ID=216777 /ORGANISM="Proboscia alata, Strain PI-D3" /LENGTH=616 /DNA_ID=CAMNT_0039278487 /DNA_START=172 /DNA_END=2019 /DNA_ORIENTATION=+